MSHVVPSVPFPHYSLRFPLAEAFPELKAMEGWGQDATCLRCGALRHHQCARWMGVCVCVCLDLFLALHLCGQGQAGLQEPSALGLPCPGPELALLASVSWFLEEDGGDLGTGTQSGRLDPVPPRTLAPHVVLSPSPLRS